MNQILSHLPEHRQNELADQIFKYPIGNSEEYRLFDILNKAYRDTRYQDDYHITHKDLKKLIFKVENLETIMVHPSDKKINV